MYKSLETIPFKIFFKIYETEMYHLLNKSESDVEDFTEEEIEVFKFQWKKIKKEYLETEPSDDESRILDLNKEIDHLISKYKLIQACLSCLKFDWNDDLINIIKDCDYTITDENYYEDIEKVELQSKSILDNVEIFKKQLPIAKPISNKISIDDMLASICAVLGIDFDFNTASYTKVKGYLKQVESKIKSLENK